MAGTAATTLASIITATLQEMGALGVADTADPDVARFLLGKWNRLMDTWNVEAAGAYASDPLSFTLTANLNPHTIGPAGSTPTWTRDPRPNEMSNVGLVIGGTTDIFIPIEMHDSDWYDNLAMPDLTATYPTDGYYNPTWPLGKLYLYPVPTAANGIAFSTRIAFAQASLLTSSVWFPPGYLNATIMTLAEESCRAVTEQDPSGDLVRRAQKARAIIFGQNDVTPTLETDVPGMGGRAGYLNYRSGMPFGR